MSEKRFTSNERWIAEGTIVDICDNGKVIMQVFDNDNIQNIVDLLNEQDKKIKELEKENDTLRMITGKELFKEIDYLKEDIQQLEKEKAEAHHLNLLASGFLIENGLAKEFLEWSKEND